MPGKSKLTADAVEQAALRALSKSEQRGEADRARAILLTLEGRKGEEIAAVLGVHISTVRNWRGCFAHGGVAATPAARTAGQDRAACRVDCRGDPDRRCAPRWRLDIATPVRRDCPARWAGDLAAVALAPIAPKGFAWRRPRHTLKGRQDAAAVEASRQSLADLKAQAAAGAIDLVFLDESEALTHPYLARCWARRGTKLRIQAPGQAKKRAMLGAFDPVHRHLFVHTSATKRSPDFVALLDRLGTAERPRPLVAVLDNGPIHTSKLTAKALAARPWLTLEWLPKYAPELNDPGSRPGQAIERCWRDLKQHYLANRTFADADALARAIPDAVARLNHERQPHPSPIRRRSA
jgi:transposase